MKEIALFNLNGRVAVSSLAAVELLMSVDRHSHFLEEIAPILDDPMFSRFTRRVRLTKMAMGAVFTTGVLEGWFASLTPLRKERMKDVYGLLVDSMRKARPEDLPLAPEGLAVPLPAKAVEKQPAPKKEESEATVDDRIFLYRDQKATSSVHVAKLLGITNSRVNAKIKQMKHLIPSHFYPSTYQYQTGKVTMNYACYLMGLEGVGEILGRFPSIDLKLRNRIYEEYQILFGGAQEEKAPAELASAITPIAEVQTELPLEEALVSVVNERIVVSSRQIAAHFGKEHKNVLRAIETLECSAEFNRLNFERVDFQDKKGESRPEYMITYEGFSFLVMGFTGKNAAMWKERYIEAFTKMKAHQNEQKQTPVFEIPQTYADALLLAANQAKTIEEQTAQLKEAEPKVVFVDEFVDTDGTYSFRDTTKIIGAPERSFINWMLEKGIVFRGAGGRLIPSAVYEKKGYFIVKTGTNKFYDKENELRTRSFQQARITPTGLVWLTNRAKKEGLLAS